MQKRKKLNIKKAGYIGTLDPDVTGVLPVFIGESTKLIDYISKLNPYKEYSGTICLGVETTTDDISGEILKIDSNISMKHDIVNFSNLLNEKIKELFLGEITQIIPKYSAKKINGKKMYEYARENIEVETKTNIVNIFSFDISNVKIEKINKYVENSNDVNVLIFDFVVKCSTGTYIRSLAKAVGESFNSTGTLVSMKRTNSNGYLLENSIKLNDLEISSIRDPFENTKLEKITVDEHFAKLLANGCIVRKEQIKINDSCSQDFLIVNSKDKYICIIEEYKKDSKMVKPYKKFNI